MTVFDLLFVGVVLGAVVALGSAGVLVLQGRRASALRRLRRLGLGLAAYMGVVTLVSLVQSRRVVGLGEDQCSDDWCVAVVSVASVASSAPGEDRTLEVLFRLSSRALRASQRERFVAAYVLDSEGRRHDADPVASDVPFDTLLGPGESVTASRRFRVPGVATDLGVVVAREGDFAFPRCCILGQGPFHRYPIVPVSESS